MQLTNPVQPDRFSAVFLDRDGVIIENRPNYVRAWDDVAFFPQALLALRRLAAAPCKIVIVTNQSAVGRGIISLEQAHQIQDRVVSEIVCAGGRVDGSFLCPHAPWEGCPCRKPKGGLLLQAAETLKIDLRASLMIGDALTDLQAGWAAGVGQVALVLTGRGAVQIRQPEVAQLPAFPQYPNLEQALNALA